MMPLWQPLASTVARPGLVGSVSVLWACSEHPVTVSLTDVSRQGSLSGSDLSSSDELIT